MTTNNQILSSLPRSLVTDDNGNTVSISASLLISTNTDLGVISNVAIQGGTPGQFIQTDGAGNLSFVDIPAPPAGSAGGGNSSIQFNNGGLIDGATNFLYNPATDTVTVNNITVNGTMNVNGTAEYNLGDIKIYGGTLNQKLVTDGTGNLSWASDTLTGAVTQVGGTGSGLGFSLTGDVTSTGNLILTAPDVTGLRSTLQIGTVANSMLSANANTWLNGLGQFTLPPGQNNPNLVVNGTTYAYANANLSFRDGTAAFNNITATENNGALEFAIDYDSNIKVGNNIAATSVTVMDVSQGTGVTFLANNTAVVNQRYNLPDNFPQYDKQALIATLPDANGISYMEWGNVDSGNANFAVEANFANFAGNVTVPAQPLITSLGVLTGLKVEGNVDLGEVANVKISGGSFGHLLSTDGNGVLSWVTPAAPDYQPSFGFTAPTNGAFQIFTSPYINSFASAEFLNITVNGVGLELADFAVAGTQLTVKRFLRTGDVIIVGATGTGGGGSVPNAYPTLNGNGKTVLTGTGHWVLAPLTTQSDASVTYADMGNNPITNLPTGTIISAINIAVTESFDDPTTTLSVTLSNGAVIMDTTDSFPQLSGSYSVSPSYSILGATVLSLNLGGGTSVTGKALVTVSYQ